MQKEPFGPISYGAVLRGLVLAERVKQGQITDGKRVSAKAGSYIIIMMMGVALFKRELARDLSHEPRSLGLFQVIKGVNGLGPDGPVLIGQGSIWLDPDLNRLNQTWFETNTIIYLIIHLNPLIIFFRVLNHNHVILQK